MVAIYYFSIQIGIFSPFEVNPQGQVSLDYDGYTPTSQVFAVRCKKVSDVEAVSHTSHSFGRAEPLSRDLRPHMLNVQTLSNVS
jgi:hypothetical protein